MAEYQEILCEKQGPICIIKLNRPKVLNALVPSVFTEINQVLDEIETDGVTRVVILTGEGRAFAAGADISYMKDMTCVEAKKFAADQTAIMRRMENMCIVFIAAVDGYALGGGCELTMACDLRVAEPNTKFALPETSLGIIPGFNGTQRLSRLVGKTVAMEMVLTNKRIGAEEALRLGLVNCVAEEGKLMDEAIALANKIVANGAVAIACGKEAVQRGLEMDFDSAMALETSLFGLLFGTEDQKEGMTAFMEKRKAEFKNR